MIRMGYKPLTDDLTDPASSSRVNPAYTDYPPSYSNSYSCDIGQPSAPLVEASEPQIQAGAPAQTTQPDPVPMPQTGLTTTTNSNISAVVQQLSINGLRIQNGRWKQSFCCGSCSDCADCCMGLFCPCLYACFLAKDMGESSGTALCNCLCWPLCLCCLRTKARGKHGIEGGLCCDCLTTQCFPCCAMIQMKEQYRNWRST